MGGLSVSAVNLSAAQVGGDLYDFVVPVEGRAGVFIGDVSGKGVSAALYMAKASSDFRYIARKEPDPGQVLDRLNSVLLKYPRGMFLTAVYLIVDVATGALNISVAGHPPFLWLTGGEVRVMSVPAGPPLGIMPHVFTATPLTFNRGDRLLLLTDGVFDAKDPSGQRLGFESLVRFVKEHAGKEQLSAMIVDYVRDFASGAERADDLTIVEMSWG
jgi:sigma-B regulation protein RsbU (phosphoserine phosphatase)